MKRIVLTVIAVMSMMPSLHARDCFLSNVEVELSDGLSLPIDSYHGGDAKVAMMSGVNFRYNFDDSPWDCGIAFGMDYACRKFVAPDARQFKQKNRTTIFGISGGANFRQYQNVNPFVNMTVGIGINDVVGDKYIETKAVSAVFIPKVGIEFFNFIRTNLYCQLSRKGYNTVGLSIGLTFGGKFGRDKAKVTE